MDLDATYTLSGKITNWEESSTHYHFDDLTGLKKTGIRAYWSIAGATTGYFYADTAEDQVARVPSGPIGSITNASSLAFADNSTGTSMSAGGIGVLRNQARGWYGAVRFDKIAKVGDKYLADVTWFYIGKSDDFSVFPTPP